MKLENRHKITKAEATALLRAAVAERGEDHVYPPERLAEDGVCMYVIDDEPACIMGMALSMIDGVTLEALQIWEGEGVDRIIESLFPQTSGEVRSAMRAVQASQDAGATWGDAVATSSLAVA